MATEIIVALITGGLAFAGVVVTNHYSNKKQAEALSKEIAVHNAVNDQKIDNLRQEVAKHNSIVERTFKLEADALLQSEQIKVANHRIDDLERKVG